MENKKLTILFELGLPFRSRFRKISLVLGTLLSYMMGYLAEDRVLPYLQMRGIAKGKKYESCHPSGDVL